MPRKVRIPIKKKAQWVSRTRALALQDDGKARLIAAIKQEGLIALAKRLGLLQAYLSNAAQGKEPLGLGLLNQLGLTLNKTIKSKGNNYYYGGVYGGAPKWDKLSVTDMMLLLLKAIRVRNKLWKDDSEFKTLVLQITRAMRHPSKTNAANRKRAQREKLEKERATQAAVNNNPLLCCYCKHPKHVKDGCTVTSYGYVCHCTGE